MNNPFISFPSIKELRSVIYDVNERAQYAGRDENREPIYHAEPQPKPKIKFRGTVKLHGANAAVVINPSNDDITYQSREHQLSLQKDNYGFMTFMSSKVKQLLEISQAILASQDDIVSELPPCYIAIFGEWAGGSINPGLAISKLPKSFYIFGVKLIDGLDEDGHPVGRWIDIDPIKHVEYPDDRIFNILQFGSWETEIDFNEPEKSQDFLAELTFEIEKQCPVGKKFDIDGIGEGLVWEAVKAEGSPSRYRFKVKGDEHASSKRSEKVPLAPEVVKGIEDFVEMAITEARLNQGLQHLIHEQHKPFLITSMGDFIKWIYHDAIKEETDTIVANQLDAKLLGSPISNKARKWFVEKLKEEEDKNAA